MGWFSTKKESEGLRLFLSEFPTWAAVHATKLVDDLKTEDKNGWEYTLKYDARRLKLIDCLIGANIFYFRNTPEGALASLLFGDDFLEKSLPSLPDEAKVCFYLAQKFYEKESQHGNSFTSSLESWYKIKIDPLDASLAFVIEQEIVHSEEFNLLVGGLLPTLNRLRVEQLEWLKTMTAKWSKIK